MVTNLDYWRNPRQAIATTYQHNDMCYQMSGIHAASLIVQQIEAHFAAGTDFFTLRELRSMRLLDVGCGTGRITRPLSYFFGSVYGYDPVNECIALAERECQPMTFDNITYSTLWPEKTDTFHAMCSINVLEHLSVNDQYSVLRTMQRYVHHHSIPVVLWWHTTRNYETLLHFFGEEALAAYADVSPHIAVDTFLLTAQSA